MGELFEKIRLRRDLWGVVWLGSGTLIALSLVSYRATDPSFNSIGQSLSVHNYCGYFGSFLADLLYQMFGAAAWLPVLASLQFAWRYFHQPNKGSSVKLQILGEAVALVTASSLLSLYGSHAHLFSNHINVGGVVGMMTSHTLVSVFNRLGASVVLWVFVFSLFVFYTDKPLLGILGKPFSIAARMLRAQWTSFQSRSSKKASLNLPNVTPSMPMKVSTDMPETRKTMAAMDRNPDLVSAPKPAPRPKITRQPMQVENWKLPDLSLLKDPAGQTAKLDEREIHHKSEVLTDKLAQFDVRGEIVGIKPGPAVTMFEFKPSADVKISKITELADDLSLALSSESVRIIAPIPGRDVVGIETSNAKREGVFLKDNLLSDAFWSEQIKLPVVLGREANGETKVVDLRKMPHLLVAGTTGSGKSAFIVSVITGLLFRHSPKTLRLVLVDPKQVDLAAFNHIPHLLMPPLREVKKAVGALRWAIREMDKRYRSMSMFGARKLEDFNDVTAKLSAAQVSEHQNANDVSDPSKRIDSYYFSPQPYLVIVVEEFGDLMAVDKINVEQTVVRLAQMARACGIHLILAMQSPRKDVVTGLIKTNIPGRISFKVASKMDSRIILDDSGAERLLAQGDMLFLAPGVAKPQRHHGAWISEAEISSIMDFWASQGEPQYDPDAMQVLDGSGGGFDLDGEASFGDVGDDEFDQRYDEVLEYVSTQKEVSASLLQRRFRLGYPRAARMIEVFEKEGVVGPANGSKPRTVLINNYQQQ